MAKRSFWLENVFLTRCMMHLQCAAMSQMLCCVVFTLINYYSPFFPAQSMLRANNPRGRKRLILTHAKDSLQTTNEAALRSRVVQHKKTKRFPSPQTLSYCVQCMPLTGADLNPNLPQPRSQTLACARASSHTSTHSDRHFISSFSTTCMLQHAPHAFDSQDTLPAS
jgi:hypothetical protein